MRMCLFRVLVPTLIVAVLVSGAAAGDEDAAGAGEKVAIDVHRARVEALYRKAAAQHAKLREFADTLRDREPGTWPEPLASEPARTAVATLVDPMADPGIDRFRAPSLLTIRHWRLWETAVRMRAYERSWENPDAPAVDVFVEAVFDVADAAPEDAWDRHLQGHKIVCAWRQANGVPEPAVEAVSGLMHAILRHALVALGKGRFEVGPWEGWLQDLSEAQNRRQTVSVGALHVQQYEVTCGQYWWFLVEKMHLDRSAVEPLLPSGWVIDDERDRVVFPEGSRDHPVTGVSFLQATAHAEWLGMRLPTEDEWERIASAGDPDRRFPWGAEVGKTLFAHRGTAEGGTTSVERFPDDVSLAGVLGLAGNVKELVATHPDRKPVKGTLEPGDRVVIRGGGFRTRPDECTTRWRWFVEAGAQEPDVGFRCVIDDAALKRLERLERR